MACDIYLFSAVLVWAAVGNPRQAHEADDFFEQLAMTTLTRQHAFLFTSLYVESIEARLELFELEVDLYRICLKPNRAMAFQG